jgi:hypothetical protein
MIFDMIPDWAFNFTALLCLAVVLWLDAARQDIAF